MWSLVIVALSVAVVHERSCAHFDALAPANVDWCEPNWQSSAHVAELQNTLSMLPSVVLCAHGLRVAMRARDENLTLSFALALWVALGSALFHGTMRRVWQAHDEVPMLLLGAWLALCAAEHRWHGSVRPLFGTRLAACSASAAALCAGYFQPGEGGFQRFLWAFATLLAGTVVQCCARALREPRRRFFPLVGFASLLVGLAAWFVEGSGSGRNCWQGLPITPHSVWHVATGVAQYYLIPFASGSTAVRPRAPLGVLHADNKCSPSATQHSRASTST